MIRRSTVRLPLAVLVTVAAAVAAVMLGRPEAALFSAPWVALLALGLGHAGNGRVRARAELLDDRVLIGDEVNLDVTVAVDGGGWIEMTPSPESGYWADKAGRVDRPLAALADVVRPGQATVIRSTLPAEVWGAHDVGRVQLVYHEPYGLFDWTGSVHEPRRVRVHPRPVDLQRLLAPWLVRRQTGVHESTASDRGIEFADIRPFGSGDSLRDINWRASARSTELLVSDRHPDRSTDLVLLVDSFVESGHDAQAVVGAAIEAAVALAESHLALTDRVGLVEMGGVLRWVTPGAGRLQLHRLTDALLGTRLYANATERDLAIVPRRGLPPRSFVIALSPLLDQRFIGGLFTLRAGGHDVAVIECVDRSADSGSDSVTPSVVHRVAAKMVDAERAMVADRLTEQAVTIGRWEAGEPLGPVLADIARRRRSGGRGRRLPSYAGTERR